MKHWMNHASRNAVLCAVICMGTFPFCEVPVHAAPTSTGGLTYTEETDSSGTTWYTFTSGTSTGVSAASGDHLKFSGVTVTGTSANNSQLSSILLIRILLLFPTAQLMWRIPISDPLFMPAMR